MDIAKIVPTSQRISFFITISSQLYSSIFNYKGSAHFKQIVCVKQSKHPIGQSWQVF